MKIKEALQPLVQFFYFQLDVMNLITGFDMSRIDGFEKIHLLHSSLFLVIAAYE